MICGSCWEVNTVNGNCICAPSTRWNYVIIISEVSKRQRKFCLELGRWDSAKACTTLCSMRALPILLIVVGHIREPAERARRCGSITKSNLLTSRQKSPLHYHCIMQASSTRDSWPREQFTEEYRLPQILSKLEISQCIVQSTAGVATIPRIEDAASRTDCLRCLR